MLGKGTRASFPKSKIPFQSPRLLVHYNAKDDLVITSDASPYCIGVVLVHRYPNGTEKPIAYASRTLSRAERKYSQIDSLGCEEISLIM